MGEASLALNLEQRQGRATVEVAGPRFSGLQGRSLSGAFRWERDVVRLERAVLEQAASRCAARVRLRCANPRRCLHGLQDHMAPTCEAATGVVVGAWQPSRGCRSRVALAA